MPTILTDALVLIIDEKTCRRCGAQSRTPVGLFVRCRGGRGKCAYRHVREIPVRSFLLCEKKVIESEVAACEHCFQASLEGQIPLFPSTFGERFVVVDLNLFPDYEAVKPNGAIAAKAKPKKEIVATPLSDF